MGKKKTDRRREIKEFKKGFHQNNPELQEDYLDWFFLSHFGKGPGFWRNLTDDKIQSFITLETEKQKDYWETWQKMFKSMFGNK